MRIVGVARVGAVIAGFSIYLMPFFGVILAVLFLQETIHFYHIFGMAAILSGIIYATKPTTN